MPRDCPMAACLAWEMMDQLELGRARSLKHLYASWPCMRHAIAEQVRVGSWEQRRAMVVGPCVLGSDLGQRRVHGWWLRDDGEQEHVEGWSGPVHARTTGPGGNRERWPCIWVCAKATGQADLGPCLVAFSAVIVLDQIAAGMGLVLAYKSGLDLGC